MKRMGNRGSALAFYAVEFLVAAFVVIGLFAILDDVLTDNVFSAAYNMSGGDSDVNATMENWETSWDAFPFVFIGSGFIVLLVLALAGGGG